MRIHRTTAGREWFWFALVLGGAALSLAACSFRRQQRFQRRPVSLLATLPSTPVSIEQSPPRVALAAVPATPPASLRTAAPERKHLKMRTVATGIAGLIGTVALCLAALGKLQPPVQRSAPARTGIETTGASPASQPGQPKLFDANNRRTQPLRGEKTGETQVPGMAPPPAPAEGPEVSSGQVAPVKRHSLHRRNSHRSRTFAQKTRAFLHRIF
jgi:hypothetical protein